MNTNDNIDRDPEIGRLRPSVVPQPSLERSTPGLR